MDPQATLNLVADYLADRDYHEAGYLLSDYWEWRRKGGFEPENGDDRANKYGRIIKANLLTGH